MFETITPAPDDAILGLMEAFRRDPHPRKINLSVGVYQDEGGRTPVLDAVRRAEERLLRGESSKSYLAIDGSREYATAVQRLMFGPEHPLLVQGRAVTSHTPGGTGALRVAADFLKKHAPGSRVWMSRPTWPNHPEVFAAAGVSTESYAYRDDAANALDFAGLLNDLRRIPAGDVVLLHACCHNPTGIDPSPQQWRQIAEVVRERKLIPLVDYAYQGFGAGLSEDSTGLLALAGECAELLVCSSFSKNFGLYCERVGALTLVAADQDAAERAQTQIRRCIRANYSNPPAHGAGIVTTILGDSELESLWRKELDGMRTRILDMRRLFVETLAAKGLSKDFSPIARQQGMFSISGLTPEQVDRLRDEYSIYIVRSGRINVAGMTSGNMQTLCAAIAEVLK